MSFENTKNALHIMQEQQPLSLLPVKPWLPKSSVIAVWKGTPSRTDVHLLSSQTAARTQPTVDYHQQVGTSRSYFKPAGLKGIISRQK